MSEEKAPYQTMGKERALNFLEIDAKHLQGSTTRFLEYLNKYIASGGEDETGMVKENLLLMVQSLKMAYTTMENIINTIPAPDAFTNGAYEDEVFKKGE